VALLYGADALTRVEDAAGLAQFVASMLDDPQRRRRARENAAAVVQRHADLPDRTAETLLALLPPAAA
jgi:3-deoxy-D-manno-octulosonic-acid transferase